MFAEPEHLILQNILKLKFDIKSKICKYNRNNKEYCYLSINKENSLKLNKITEPFFKERETFLTSSSTTKCQNDMISHIMWYSLTFIYNIKLTYVAQGALPTYELDIDVAAVVVSSNGAVPESRVWGSRVMVPTWEVASNPTIRFAEAQRRRFNVIDRAIQKARQELMAQEDLNVFAALDAAATVENQEQDMTDTGMLKRDLLELKKQVDKWDLLTAKFFMHINEFNDILNWGSGGGQGTGGGDFDPVNVVAA